MKKNKIIKLVLIDNHVLFRKGLKAILSDYPDLEIIGDFSSLAEGLPLLKSDFVDILIIDTDFSEFSGKELKKMGTSPDSSLRILALTFEKSASLCLEIINSGVDGYLLKEEEIESLIDKLEKILSGQFVLSEKLNTYLVELIQEKMKFPIDYLLSDREIDVIKLLQEGMTNKEISEKLYLSENTIKTHLKHIYRKLSVKNRKEAIIKAKLWGIFN